MIPIYENNTERFRIGYPSSLTFPVHLHSQIELLYVLEGRVQMTIGSSASILEEGDLGIVFPNRIHSYQSEESTQANRCLLFICPADAGMEFHTELMQYHPTLPFITGGRLHPDIYYVLNALKDVHPPEDISVLRAYTQLLLARILPQLTLKRNRDVQEASMTAQLITYLAEHFTESVSQETLAYKFGISPYQISRIFNDKMHISFCGYLNQLRIDFAKALLQTSKENILDISMSCGYENSRTFNREFLKICGCTPREYRQMLTLHQSL